jgi:hypothetical protein
VDKIALELAPRNDPLGFAQRAWSNLLEIEEKFKQDGVEGRAHVVTQMVQSLLALLVFPQQKSFFEHFSQWPVNALDSEWLPTQEFGNTEKLGDLLRHMRNAVCHGLVAFSGASTQGPDCRFVDEISVVFSDRSDRKADINWQVRLEGRQIKRFLYNLLEMLHDGVPGPFENT